MSNLPASSWDEFFAFEENLESMLVAYFQEYGLPDAGQTRSNNIYAAPFVGVTFRNGEPNTSSQMAVPGYPTPGAFYIWRVYSGAFMIRVSTIRQNDPNDTLHNKLIAKVRKLMQTFHIVGAQTKYQQIDLVMDLREAGSGISYEQDNEKGIDYTEITWNITHSLNPAALPTNLN